MELYLFNEGLLRDLLESRERQLADEVKAAPEDHVLQVDADAWVAALVQKYSLEALVLNTDGMYQGDPVPVEVDVSWDRSRYFSTAPPFVEGHRTKIHLPFSGDEVLLRMRPSRYPLSGSPRAGIRRDELLRSVEYPDDAPLNVAADGRGWASKIQEHLTWSANDLTNFPTRLEQAARGAITARQESIRKHREHVAKTSLPIRSAGDRSKTYIAEAVVRRPPPPVPEMSLSQPVPLEPAMTERAYEDIVETLLGTAEDIERSAKTYRGMSEEDLRHVMLLPLNDRYRGQAAAEAFNSEGKTDALVRWDDRNLFIAEFKKWRGQKEFLAALEQLYRYKTWRDAGIALVVILEEGNLSSVIETTKKVLQGHQSFREWGLEKDGLLRVVVNPHGDQARSARLAVIFVNLSE